MHLYPVSVTGVCDVQKTMVLFGGYGDDRNVSHGLRYWPLQQSGVIDDLADEYDVLLLNQGEFGW